MIKLEVTPVGIQGRGGLRSPAVAGGHALARKVQSWSQSMFFSLFLKYFKTGSKLDKLIVSILWQDPLYGFPQPIRTHPYAQSVSWEDSRLCEA